MEKLKWKVSHSVSFDDEFDFLETILNDYGVKDIGKFLNPIKEDENNSFLMKNMKKAVKTVHKALEDKEKWIYIKGDCDVDGVTSTAIMVQFLRAINPEAKIHYSSNYNKRHGLFFSDLEELPKEIQENLGLIIVPDASVSLEQAGQIRKEDKYVDIPIVVLDHHDLSEEMDTITTITVNCMDGVYPNNTLSGAGVVYKFGEAYCDLYELDKRLIEQFIDLAAVGIISDSMALTDKETRYLVVEGLKEENQKNLFLNELQSSLEEEMKFGRTIISVGWVLAPKVNGVIRYGKPKEQNDLFRAICGEDENIEYQPRRKHKEDPKPDVEIQTLQKAMARIANNVKSRQDTEVRKFVTKIEEEIEAKNLLNNSVLFIDGTGLVTKNTVTGLIANKLASKYQRPVILLKEFNDKTFGGSGRGYDKGNIENFKDLINDLDVFISAEGHQSAFGIKISKDKVDEAIKKCNNEIPIDSLCTVYPVDWEIEAVNLKNKYIKEVAENYKIWGNNIPEPIFAIKNLHINASDINGYGENNGFIRFVYKDIPFIKKYCKYNDFNNMTCVDDYIMGENTKDLTLNIIGQFILNSWENKIFPQVKILYFDSCENTEGIGLRDSGNSKKKTNKVKLKAFIDDDNDDILEKASKKSFETTKKEVKKNNDEDLFKDFVF